MKEKSDGKTSPKQNRRCRGRGAGRGIARALGEAGATVYCTGRSVRGNPSPYNRPETIEETAELVNVAGGVGIWVRVDHTVEAEVKALFERLDREHGHLDVLVNSIAGEDPMMGGWTSFKTKIFSNPNRRFSSVAPSPRWRKIKKFLAAPAISPARGNCRENMVSAITRAGVRIGESTGKRYCRR